MYIPQINCKTQGLRKAYLNSLTNDRHYNIKALKNIDKNIAATYSNTRYYGGSLKSFWQKIKKFGKKVLNAPAQIASKIYPHMKKGIDFLAKNDTVKGLISAIPKAGPAINMGLEGLSKITDNVDSIIDSIKNKNPSVSLQQAKDLISNIKTTTENVVNKVPMSDDQKNKIKDNVNKIYKKLPDVIKSEGLDKVNKAAGYLPFVDSSTLTVKEKTGKGGSVKQMFRFRKPMLITKNQELFSKLPKYDPDTVGKIGGAIFGKAGPKEGCGTSDSKSGRTKLSGGEDSELRQNILNRLRSRSGRVALS